MEKRRREILAIGLLVLLGVGIAAAMTWYLVAGHSWNKAASHIDDLVGSMEGYLVVLCDSGPTVSEESLLEEQAREYRSKEAAVVMLHTSQPQRYDDPLIVSKGAWRVGICSALGSYNYVEVRDKALRLKRAGADFVVVLADDDSILSGWLREIDLVVVAGRAAGEAVERQVGSALCVSAAEPGELLSVSVAPSGVMTTRTRAIGE